jgi:hypothetical protein
LPLAPCPVWPCSAVQLFQPPPRLMADSCCICGVVLATQDSDFPPWCKDIRASELLYKQETWGC